MQNQRNLNLQTNTISSSKDIKKNSINSLKELNSKDLDNESIIHMTNIANDSENINVNESIVSNTIIANSSSKEKQNLNNLKEKDQNNHNYNNSYGIDLLRQEIILSHRPPQGTLSELVFLNDLKKLKKIISHQQIDINTTDLIGITHTWTPLYWSVKLRRIECMLLLLAHGADMNIVVNDSEECCGTVLDLSTLREDEEIENLLREHAEKEDVNLGQSFKAIRTKLRGKAPAFNFRYYGKNSQYNQPQFSEQNKKVG